MALSLLANVDALLGFAILILTVFYRFQVPPVLGFLVTGMLIGPYGLGILNGVQNVELNADLGVVFLLFTIGVDLSLKELWKMKKALFAGWNSPDPLNYISGPHRMFISGFQILLPQSFSVS